MKKIKVLEVGLDTNLGGIETYLLNLASGIDKSSITLDFLAYDDKKPCFNDELTALGCGIRYVRSRRTSWFGNARDLKKLIAEEEYDIIHCHLNSLTYITPAIEGLKAGCKVIVQSHNGGMAQGSSSKILNAINRVRLPYNRVSLVAVSDVAGRWMFGKRHCFTVISNGIDTDAFKFNPEIRKQIRSEFGITDDCKVIVHVGAFRTQKNHSFILNVFNEYHKKHKNSFLILVGDGELKRQMMEKAESLDLNKSVIFTGNRNDVPDILSASDAFLFPSLYEGFGLALLEAEANGLNCVTSDVVPSQICFENCIRLSLDSPYAEWVKALETESNGNRESFANMVEKAGFGIDSKIREIERLYRS